MDRETEAAALDARIMRAIAHYALSSADFERLACDLFAHQWRWNAPYAAYASACGITAARLPQTVAEIPAVPAAAFKEAVLCTVDEARAATWFQTSGTTNGHGGRHYFESTALYEAALLAGFDRGMLADGARLRYLLLVPDARRTPHSSLGFMLDRVCAQRGDGREGRYIDGERLDLAGFEHDIEASIAEGIPVCIAATAFALVTVVDALVAKGRRYELTAGSRVMETGGFKGRTRSVERSELYAGVAGCFGIPSAAIVAEYGMTELSSQYYDSLDRDGAQRYKVAPPWLRALVVDPSGAIVPDGIVGAIRHVDCANRSSVVAIETEDLGVNGPRGLLLLGRDHGAALRGCSLDAEELAARA